MSKILLTSFVKCCDNEINNGRKMINKKLKMYKQIYKKQQVKYHGNIKENQQHISYRAIFKSDH